MIDWEDHRGAVELKNLKTARNEIRIAREAAAVASRESGRSRAGIAAVDALLAIIEEGHLAGANRRGGIRPAWLESLERVGLTVPAQIIAARNTVELHARLLEWQEELLSQRDPRRSALLATLDGPEADPPFVVRRRGHPSESRPAGVDADPAQPLPGRLWAWGQAFGYEPDKSG